MTTARDVIVRAFEVEGRKYGWPTGNIWPMAADIAIAALLSAPESVRLELAAKLNPWRAIESAPKDGTYLRLAANGRIIQPLAWGWSPNAQIHAWCGVVEGCILPHDPQPTHWLPQSPLPAPPSEDKQ
jgi:hypothetical protein